jgi:thioredoxin reductase
MPFDDVQTDRAVDDIIAKEADTVLAAEDAAAGTQTVAVHRKGKWKRFWRSKWTWYSITFLLLVGVATVAAVQPARYWTLNELRVKASSSVLVTDELTRQPLKNVTVRIGSASVSTGSDGMGRLSGLRLGPAVLTISRPGFADYHRNVTIGWGGNPFGTVGLQATGVQYTVRIQDFLTGKGIEGAEVDSGDAAALSDANGKAVLIMSGSATGDLPVTVRSDGYRGETATVVALTKQPVPISMITSRKAVYVSKQGVTYDVVSSDIDGQNKKVLLAGSGLEGANISLAVSPDGSRAALVSTRDDQKDADGYLLNTLTIISVATGDTVTIAHAEQIRLIDWAGTRLVFEQVTTDQSGQNSKYSVIAYDYAANSRVQLVAANTLKTALTAQGNLYYSLVASDTDTSVKPGLYAVGLDGNGKRSVLSKEPWSVYRTDYNSLSVQTADGWYVVDLAKGTSVVGSIPTTYASRQYVDSPANNAQSLWVEVRGEQGTLLRYDRKTGKDTVATATPGLVMPVRWLTDDTAIYRLTTNTETADYAVSTLGGGTPHKIADVINTYGFTTGL